MKTLHYKQGYKAATNGEFRASPNLKILTPAWRDWYKGYDVATKLGSNNKLDPSFSLRQKSNNFSAAML